MSKSKSNFSSGTSAYLVLFILIICFSLILFGTNPNIYEQKSKNKSIVLSPLTQSISTEFKWNRTWGGSNWEEGHGIAFDSLGFIYIVGYTGSFGVGGWDMTLVKYNKNGVQQWNRTWGIIDTAICYGVVLDSLDNIYLAGSLETTGPGIHDMILVKYDKNGIQQWNRTWGGVDDDEGYGVAIDSLDNVYIAGDTLSFGEGETDMVLVKYDGNGVQQWNRTWGGIEYDECSGTVGDSIGNIYIAGTTTSFSAGPADPDMVLVKYDANGVQQWNRTWNGDNDDVGNGVGIDASDNVYLVGQASIWETVGFAWDMAIVKYNGSGVQQWNQTWGGEFSDYGEDVAIDSSGSVYCVGATRSFGVGERDIALIKFDENGEQQWNFTWGGSQYDYGEGVVVEAPDIVYLAGTTANFGVGLEDMVLIKYGPYIEEEPQISGYNVLLLVSLSWLLAFISVIYFKNKIKKFK